MDSFFEELEYSENGILSKTQHRWYNGNGYFPLTTYKISFDYLYSTFVIDYEYRGSQFKKPNFIGGGAFGDRHICQVVCSFESGEIQAPKFKVSGRNILEKVFRRKKLPFHAKCKDSEILKILKANPELLHIFNTSESSADFFPLIIGEHDKMSSKYIIRVNYNTVERRDDILFSVIIFVKNIIDTNTFL